MTATTTRAAECWARILAAPDGYPMGIAADFATDDGSEPAEACAAVEAVAQQHLDAHPDDHRARRLLGEWLQWHGDARGEGLCALAAYGRSPCGQESFLGSFLWWDAGYGFARPLPQDWFWAAMGEVLPPQQRIKYDTRRAAEDAASLAFARLPAERRAALLRGEM